MHSCEVVVPPAQGAALLLELGTLIIEGRSSKVVSKANLQTISFDKLLTDGYASTEVTRGALPKRPAPSATNSAHLSPAKRNRDQGSIEQEDESVCEAQNKHSSENIETGKIGISINELSEGLSVYELKARLINAGSAPLRGRAEALWRDHTPLCIEVSLAPSCGACREPLILVERWTMFVYSRRAHDQTNFITSQWLLNAVRSQLHFSQISAWDSKLKTENSIKEAKARRDLSPSERQRKLSRETCNFKKYESNCDEETLKSDTAIEYKNLNLVYSLKIPDETFKSSTFHYKPTKHTFPVTDIGSNIYLEVHLESLPRLEDIPIVKCLCFGNTLDVYKRRKSKDIAVDQSPTDDNLARKLNASCSLAESNSSDESNSRMKRTTFSPELGIINSDMGCSSGISRKLSIYSSPNTPEFGYHSTTASSRGSTPDRVDLDSGFSGSKNDSKSPVRDGENSYQVQFSSESNIRVPSHILINANYLVDDRMQTPCRQSGKHRCNCDDESDQGNKVSTVNINGNDHLKSEKKVKFQNDEKVKEEIRFQIRLKKDKKDCRDDCNALRKDRKNDLICSRKIRTCSSSENSDSRSSPELVHYKSVCNNCCVEKSKSKNHESNNTTSIPILQASKFDHVNRFGNLRSAVSSSLSIAGRKFYSLKQQQGCDQMGSIISCCGCQNQDFCSSQNILLEIRNPQSNNYTFEARNRDDDYRPSIKKLISSYTQTDDILCECGRSLVPMCFECSKLSDLQNGNIQQTYNRAKMKRSDANHDLAAVDKSLLLLKAIERTGKRLEEKCDSERCRDVENSDKKLVVGHDEKVIDYNCDNSVSTINNCECDKSSLYSDSFNRVSCTNEMLSHSTPLFSVNYNSINTPHLVRDDNLAKSDLSIYKRNPSGGKYKYSAVKKLSFEDKSPDRENLKPKLKRSLAKIDRVVVDRNRRKMNTENTEDEYYNDDTDEDILYKDEESGISYMTAPNKNNKWQDYYQTCFREMKTTKNTDNQEEKDHIIVYDRGDYGTFGDSNDNDKSVPSVIEMDKFRLRLDSAASMVFHSGNGLPLTSSPAPLRRGKSCFDYDSSINSVSSIKSALYGLSTTDLETHDPNPALSPGSSPGSPCHALVGLPVFNYNAIPKTSSVQQIFTSRHNKFRHGTSSGLLGSFEESVLNGRLEPAATVAGFTAEIGASGEFCPSHLKVPVTVFFYSLGDNTTSAPYLGHINLGRRGYCVPRAGTIQVTLFNPHGTVVKMFVVMYDLRDMPPHSRTFLRQRTLWGGTCLRYLIHLRFLTSKSGKVYLHTDIRIIVSRKADLDTAVAHSLTSGITIDTQKDANKKNNKKGCRVETGTFERRAKRTITPDADTKLNRSDGCYELSTHCNNNQYTHDTIKKSILNNKSTVRPAGNLSSVLNKELSYELRSFTYGPENPKYSPR